jgi:uncharacterized membrane protein YgdD (TMEM256/DUF423 family)
MQKTFLSFGCIMGGLAVVLGAFGAHALKTKLNSGDLQIFETGVRYQMYHALSLLAIGMLIEKFPFQSALPFAGYCFIAGTILFSGSLYLLASRVALGIENWRWLGPITPLGGMLLLGGWICLLMSVSSCKAQKNQTEQILLETKPAAYRLIVSFISTGAGTDNKAYSLFEKHIESLSNENKQAYHYDLIPWGREGEIDCCFKLHGLSPHKQQELIDQLKALFKDHPLVQFKEHVIETRTIKNK